MKSKIVFGDDKLKRAFDELENSKTEDKILKEWLERAFKDIENDAFCSIQIPKRLIPSEYEKRFRKLDNLWKYDLPKGWRLIYTIKNGEIIIISVVLEWMGHKEYERRFKY